MTTPTVPIAVPNASAALNSPGSKSGSPRQEGLTFRRRATPVRVPTPQRLTQALRRLRARETPVVADSQVEPRTDGPRVTVAPRASVTPAFESHSPEWTERRRFLRRRSAQLIRILPCSDVGISPRDLEWALHESPDRGQMLNLSMNGVAFRLKRPLAPSTRVWLQLESRAREFAVIRTGRVVRVAPASNSEWTVTCRFDRCVPYAEVVQLSHDLA